MTRMRATGLLAAALLLAGGAFDSPSLYVPAVGLALLAAAAAAWVGLAARGASVERVPGAWSVVEGESYRLDTRVRGGRFPAPGGRLVDPLLDRPLPLGARFAGELEAETSFERRGRRKLPTVTLEIRDPFGLRVAAVRGSEAREVLVLPRVEAVSAPLFGGQRSLRGGDGGGPGEDGGLDAEAVDFELDGLRPYRVGTPASRIHWRSVARTGELIEHRMVSGGGTEPLVVLDAHRPEGREALDRAVRAAASLCVHLARAGGCSLLLPGQVHPSRLDTSLRGWSDLHARMALVEKSRRPPALPHRGSVVCWVSASPNAGAAAAAAGVGSGYLVTPGEPRSSDAFGVAGCRGRSLRREEHDRIVARAA
jgi:uncharacterized protein (DUF58 family)